MIAADGAGGALVAWQDARSLAGRDIFAARITSGGGQASGWPANGLQVTHAAREQRNPALVVTGSGGAIAAWVDYRNGTGQVSDLYFGSMSAGGSLLGVPAPTTAERSVRAWPNPFLDRVSLGFSLPRALPVTLEVFDVAGRRVWSSSATLEAGPHELEWNGGTARGVRAGPGIYLLRARGLGFEATRTVVLAR